MSNEAFATISKIEDLIVDRLKKGLGKIVSNVGSYGGELDDGTFESIRQLPAVWVTYGGAKRIDTANTAQSRYREQHLFVVMCTTRSIRSEAATRQNGIAQLQGAHPFEIGTYQLIDCVKRLLINQTFNHLIFNGLKAQQVRTLFNNTRVQTGALSCFAVEFEAIFNNSSVLDDGRYPEITADPTHPDFIFNSYENTTLDDPYPDLETINARIEDALNTDSGQAAYVESVTKLDK